MKQSEIDAAVAAVHRRNAKQLGDGVYMTTVTTHLASPSGGHHYVDDDMSVVHGFVWFPLGTSRAKRCGKTELFKGGCIRGLDAHDEEGEEELVAGKEYSSRPAFIVTDGPGTVLKIITDSD
jgi:hypothetical protein